EGVQYDGIGDCGIGSTAVVSNSPQAERQQLGPFQADGWIEPCWRSLGSCRASDSRLLSGSFAGGWLCGSSCISAGTDREGKRPPPGARAGMGACGSSSSIAQK